MFVILLGQIKKLQQIIIVGVMLEDICDRLAHKQIDCGKLISVFLSKLKDVCANWEIFVKTEIYLCQLKDICANLKDICHVEDHGTDPSPLGKEIKHLCICSSQLYQIILLKYQISILNDSA